MTLARNATIFTFSGITAESIEEGVNHLPFIPLFQLELSKAGFVPPIDDEHRMVHVANNIVEVRLRDDVKILPASMIKEETKARVKKIKDELGLEKLSRNRMKEIKSDVTDELLAKALFKTNYTRAWFDFDAGLLVVDSSSPTKTQSMVTLLRMAIIMGDYTINQWKVNGIPSSYFTAWIDAANPPPGLTIDDQALLMDEDGGTIKISDEDVSLCEIRNLTEGRKCVELAMTIQDEISLVLTEDMIAKKITYLDLITADPSGTAEDAIELHEADTLISAHAARTIFSAINKVMGGLAGQKAHKAA